MAEAAVEFLLQNLKQLFLYHVNLIEGAEEEVKKLQMDLNFFAAFLKIHGSRKRRKDGTFQELIRQIRDVVYEAEDVIDAFVTQTATDKSNSKRYLKTLKKPVHLHDIALRVEPIRKRIEKIYGGKTMLDFATLPIHDGDPEEPEVPQIKQDKIVGFEDEAEKIKGYLNEAREQLDVISVVGMPGLGKTTLAGKIFHDKDIQYKFPTRIWVYVSQDFTKRKVFLAILEELKMAKDMYEKSDQELANKVQEELREGKFLLVMDDVWTTEDWDKIRIALPERNSAGKVLITSRDAEVAKYANRERSPHKLRFMTPVESWQLFQYEVFGKLECPSELETIGQVIVGHCRGLPLAIVVIAGILVKKFSALNDKEAKRKSWIKVSESVSTYLTMEERMEKIIALSYDKLPHHLRSCFLYLAMFPEDFEIPVWKLIRMWIAEGFIQQKGNISVEEMAENYLDELISRNLVRADKRRPDGRVKSCRIHDVLRAFCIDEARSEKENFLQEINGMTFEGINNPPSAMKSYRRISLHSNVSNFISSVTDLGGKTHVRSFVCFSKEDHTLPAEKIKAIPVAFKLLRVLDVEPLKIAKVPSDMYKLIHLRYIVLSFNLSALPPSFTKLWNLETLIAYTTSRTLQITVDIWKLSQLRHLKTNASAELIHKTGQSSKGGENLQSLGTISPESCTGDVLNRCCSNLKKLGVRGRLVSLVDSKSPASFEILKKLISLEKLKLLNVVFPQAASEDPLTCLPPPHQFPPNLKSLTLSETFLNWSTDISVLGLLKNLEVLKLKDKAFMGMIWEAEDGGFLRLEFLHIGRTNLSVWKASKHHYPKLRCLELRNCEDLQGIPLGLADIPTFRILDLQHSNHAASSANQIHGEKLKKSEEFIVTIFPPPARHLIA